MDHSERGTKRICPTTGRKFYDLNRDPVISPYTGEVVPTAVATTFARSAPPAFSRSKPVVDEEERETDGPELVSLDEVEAEEADAAGDDTGNDDDLTIEDDSEDDSEGNADDTLIEDEDEDSATDLVDVEDDDED